jgi:protocatechuate 3,4-dioxygenase beta subunit
MQRPGRVAIVVVVTCGALVRTASQQGPPVAGRAVLAGTVVEAGTNQPIAGATVTLGGAPSASGSPVVFSFGQASILGGTRQTLTNAQGHFLFPSLPAGSYTVQAERKGFIPGGVGKTRATGLPQLITVGEDDRTTDLRIALSRYATVSGRVLDEAGEPVVGVTVVAMRRAYYSGRPQYVSATNGMADDTDDRGEFHLLTLIPGEYVFSIRATQTTIPMSVVEAFRSATAAGTVNDFNRELRTSGSFSVGSTTGGIAVGNLFFQPYSFGTKLPTSPPPDERGTLLVYPTYYHPSARRAADAAVVTLRSGDEKTGIDFRLSPVPASRVSGVVTGPAGPVANLVLSLFQVQNELEDDTFFATATAMTDGRGAFTMLGVPAGQYELRTVKMPLMPANAPPPGTAANFVVPDEPTQWAAMPLTLAGEDVKDLAISLQTGVRVSGRVEFEGSAARPADSTGRQCVVSIDPVDGRPVLSDLRRVACNADGRLSSFELPPGRYYISATFPGWTLKSAIVEGVDASTVPFDLRREVTSLVVTFTNRLSSVGGSVRSAKGELDGGAQVLLFPVEAAAPGFVGSNRRFKTARVSADGAYRLTSVPPGDYFVIAVADDAANDFPSRALVQSLARQAARVTVGDAEDKNLDLTTVVVR